MAVSTAAHREVVLRTIEPDDAIQIHEILEDTWSQRYVGPGLMPAQMLPSFADPSSEKLVGRTRERLDKYLVTTLPIWLPTYTGAYDHGSEQLLGFVKWWYGYPEGVKPSSGHDQMGAVYVESLNVRTAQQQRGYGSLLVSSVAERAAAAKFSHVALDVVMGNIAARLFYFRRGFQESAPYSAFPGTGKLPSMNRIRQTADEYEMVGVYSLGYA